MMDMSGILTGAAIVQGIMGVLVGRQSEGRTGRQMGVGSALVGVLAGALCLWLGAGELWLRAPPLFGALVGLTAVAMGSVAEAGPRTLRHILWVNGATALLFATRDPILLAVFFTLTVAPPYLELRGAPGATRPEGARFFLAYMLPSVLLVGAGAVLLAQGKGVVAVLPLAVGLAIREAVVPVHSWLPGFVERTPMGLVVAFVSPQVGVFAHLVWLSGGLPPALSSGVAVLGAVTAVFAALMGVAQVRPRRSLAFLIMSQTALVAFGLETHSVLSRTGTVAAWWVTGLATAGFAMAVSALEARRGPLSLDRPGGSFERVPRLATAFLILGMASVGLPGTLGFVAEDLLLQGTVGEFPLLGLALIVTTAINGVTVMRCFFTLFTGSRQSQGERDLTPREWATLSVLMALLLGAGLAPGGPVAFLGSVTGGAAPTPSGHVSPLLP